MSTRIRVRAKSAEDTEAAEWNAQLSVKPLVPFRPADMTNAALRPQKATQAYQVGLVLASVQQSQRRTVIRCQLHRSNQSASSTNWQGMYRIRLLTGIG